VTIVSYNIATKIVDKLRAALFKVVICDESHYIKVIFFELHGGAKVSRVISSYRTGRLSAPRHCHPYSSLQLAVCCSLERLP